MDNSGKYFLWRRALAQASVSLTILVSFLASLIALPQNTFAGDIKISIPRRSRLTPVQQLNRDGVEALKKRQYNKAKALFYKAYLFDPGDPFTLNNLGYVAELEGDADRARGFYSLAAAQPTEALIDRASAPKLEGESVRQAIGAVGDTPMQVNRANVEVVHLLAEGRVREADVLLQRTLALDPGNPFTLNNIGVVKESEGEYSQALKYYTAATAAHTGDPVIVSMNAEARGKPLSEMARQSAARLQARMSSLESNEAKVAMLNLRGVAALNRNDSREAWEDFSQAYKLGPHNAFSLNNQGFMAELDGDLESAQEFYREAQSAGFADTRVGLATRPHAEGRKLLSVAEESENQASTAIATRRDARRRSRGPVELKRRDGSPVGPEATPPPSQTASPQPR